MLPMLNDGNADDLATEKASAGCRRCIEWNLLTRMAVLKEE